MGITLNKKEKNLVLFISNFFIGIFLILFIRFEIQDNETLFFTVSFMGLLISVMIRLYLGKELVE